jgi:hypothetical protein
MDGRRNWTKWMLGACGAVVLAGAGIAFLPNDDDAACWRAAWLAKEAWNGTDLELGALQRRLSAMQLRATDDSIRGRMQAEWELWAAARQASNVAATQSDRLPQAAKDSSQAALEACWLARDNTDPVPIAKGLPGRTYKPGALVVRACEEAAARSEGAWKACEHKMTKGYQLSLLGGQSDYAFFGGGCFDF